MSAPKKIIIKESLVEIKRLIKKSNPMIGKRLHALFIFKQNEISGISKREVAQAIGVDHNSAQLWRTLYECGGIELLTKHSKTGFKPSVITKQQEEALKEQMYDPNNGFVGFVELLAWFNEKFETQINYKTFQGFVVRKFNAKVKTARKVHVKKDPASVEDFKKNSTLNVKKSSIKNPKNAKQ